MDKRLKSKRKGQSLVETALVLPVLLIILTGIFDFGMLFNNYLMVSNASREGARTAVVGATDTEITTAVDTVAGSLDSTRLTITINPDQAAGRSRGDAITVTVKYQYKMITPIIAAIVPGPIDLISSTTMRCE